MNPSIDDFPDSKHYFKALPPTKLKQLPIKYFEPGATIMEENTTQNDFYLILSGVCFSKKNRLLSNKQRSIHRIFYKNQFVGIQELLSNRASARLITIYAKTEVYALVMNKQHLIQWQTENPVLFNNILAMILDQHFDNHTTLINCLNYEPFTAFIYYLCYLYDIYLYSCYNPGYTGYVKIHDTREELCYYSKKDIRTINRYIRQLRDDSLITLIKGKLHINQPQYRALLYQMEKLS